jgi:hypothetical protein
VGGVDLDKLLEDLVYKLTIIGGQRNDGGAGHAGNPQNHAESPKSPEQVAFPFWRAHFVCFDYCLLNLHRSARCGELRENSSTICFVRQNPGNAGSPAAIFLSKANKKRRRKES